MPTNKVFNNFTSTKEQDLLESLVVESIRQNGHDVHYIRREGGDVDPLFEEDANAVFSDYTVIEMFIETSEGFEGDAEFLSHFSVEVHDQIKLSVASKTFMDLVGDPEEIDRPREGDLIHIPVTNALFEIKFVEHEEPFYQLGKINKYVLTLEKYVFSHETFSTGLDEVDDSIAAIDELTEDPTAQNDLFETEGDKIIDFSEINPFSEGF